MKTNTVRLFAASLLGCFAVAANAAVIDFTADSGGSKANGFSASGHPGVTFSDTVGANLNVGSYFESNNSKALAVFDDSDGSKLRMDFLTAQNFLSLDFGNDDPFFASASDRAWLELFNGATSVGLVSMAMNLDDLMNQTISYLGGPFNGAEFWYGDAAGNPNTHANNTGLIEVVDNIVYEARDGQDVPDTGATLSLVVLGLLGVAAVRRRQIA
jgi:hypothetical protein